MTSKAIQPTEAYVWIWLPGETTPVVAGRLYEEDGSTNFIYGQSYLAWTNAIAISEMELPLRPGPQAALVGLQIAGAIRDGAPDAWGRRVILNRTFGKAGLADFKSDPLNRGFDNVCTVGKVGEVDRNIMRATQMLNDYAFDGLPPAEFEMLSGIRNRFRLESGPIS